jgi:uncharacterized protein (TIGR00369 family)
MVPRMSERTRWDAIRDGSIDVPVNRTLGFEFVDHDDPTEYVAMNWAVPAEHCNSAGNIQGGILGAFLDALLGSATAAYLPESHYPALAEMKISIFRPAPAGAKLYGKGWIVKPGKRVLFAEAEVRDDVGELVAKASGTEIPIQL